MSSVKRSVVCVKRSVLYKCYCTANGTARVFSMTCRVPQNFWALMLLVNWFQVLTHRLPTDSPLYNKIKQSTAVSWCVTQPLSVCRWCRMTHTPPGDVPAGQDITITAEVAPNKVITAATLNYLVNYGPPQQLPLSGRSGNASELEYQCAINVCMARVQHSM